MTAGAMYRLRVLPDDGEEFEVAAYSRDVRMWERQGRDRKFSDMTPERISMTNIYAIAFTAAKRQGLWDRTQAEFEETCDVVMLASDEDSERETDPTSEGP